MYRRSAETERHAGEQTTALFRYSGATRASFSTYFDLLQQSTPLGKPLIINDRTVSENLQQNPQAYDKNGGDALRHHLGLHKEHAGATLTPPCTGSRG